MGEPSLDVNERIPLGGNDLELQRSGAVQGPVTAIYCTAAWYYELSLGPMPFV